MLGWRRNNGPSSHSEVIMLLIRANANVEPGDVAEAARACPSAPIMTALLAASGDLGPDCGKLLKPYLDIAVASSNVEVVKVLLAHKADPNAISSDSNHVKIFEPTCLMMASNQSHRDDSLFSLLDAEIIRSLIGANADVERFWYVRVKP